MATASIWPRAPKSRSFLTALLQGDRVTTIDAMLRFNLQTPNARAAEMRKLGWPIRAIKVPHPNLPREQMVAYVLDGHFRAWHLANPQAHPSTYPGQDGRGKFRIRDTVPALRA